MKTTTAERPSGAAGLACVTSGQALARAVAGFRARGERVALVPTMGGLHAGHLSLLDQARRHADRVVVSIYVNPTQFAAGEDFARYPRDLEADRETLSRAGADLLFAPDDATVYPHGLSAALCLAAPPALAGTLCGLSRAGHFDGVVSVVARLFNLVRPDAAVFGEKDYQQLLIVEYLARDLGYPIDIVRAPLCRDSDGLAFSSRNVYLTAAERRAALALPHTLESAARALTGRRRERLVECERQGWAALRAAGLEPEYFTVRDAGDLGPPRPGGSWRILAAARVGRTRLIDNWAVP